MKEITLLNKRYVVQQSIYSLTPFLRRTFSKSPQGHTTLHKCPHDGFPPRVPPPVLLPRAAVPRPRRPLVLRRREGGVGGADGHGNGGGRTLCAAG